MPTLLGLCGLEVPKSVEGTDFTGVLVRREKPPADAAALIACYSPFGEYTRARGGREYRGVRTERYTYVRDLKAPWLLFDNEKDPYQMTNLVGKPEAAEVQARLETLLQRELKRTGDEFLPGEEYVRKWGYKVDTTGTLPTRP
jgi:arylsulfatase A-like enzyme